MFLRIIGEEKSELDQKIDKLQDFIESDNFYNVDDKHQELLKLQLHAMESYSMILGKRLLLFSRWGLKNQFG